MEEQHQEQQQQTAKFKVKTANGRTILDMIQNSNTIVKKHHTNSAVNSANEQINWVPYTMLDFAMHR